MEVSCFFIFIDRGLVNVLQKNILYIVDVVLIQIIGEIDEIKGVRIYQGKRLCERKQERG